MTTKKKRLGNTYPVSGEIFKNGRDTPIMSFNSQLYKIGVYIIENNDPSRQGGFNPEKMVKYTKNYHPSNIVEGYHVKLGREITVTTDENGFFVEVK